MSQLWIYVTGCWGWCFWGGTLSILTSQDMQTKVYCWESPHPRICLLTVVNHVTRSQVWANLGSWLSSCSRRIYTTPLWPQVSFVIYHCKLSTMHQAYICIKESEIFALPLPRNLSAKKWNMFHFGQIPFPLSPYACQNNVSLCTLTAHCIQMFQTTSRCQKLNVLKYKEEWQSLTWIQTLCPLSLAFLNPYLFTNLMNI